MTHVDEAKLESDTLSRFQYLTEFIGFGEADICAIADAKDWLAPKVAGLVDAVYQKLFSYDATKRHFAVPQSGYAGPQPVSLADLAPNHPLVAFRKDKLANYLVRLVTQPYDSKMAMYLDFVGKIHTEKAGNPGIKVPLIQMNALMGFVADALNATILAADLPADTKARTLRAFSKLLWIQNDLIGRHYQA